MIIIFVSLSLCLNILYKIGEKQVSLLYTLNFESVYIITKERQRDKETKLLLQHIFNFPFIFSISHKSQKCHINQDIDS